MMGWVALGLVMSVIELWWAAAFLYAYQQLRQRRLLFQVAMGLLLVVFFGFMAVNAANGREGFVPIQIVAVLVSLGAAIAWRSSGGPELLRERYTNRLTDVLRFRRPAVDMRRRVRSK